CRRVSSRGEVRTNFLHNQVEHSIRRVRWRGPHRDVGRFGAGLYYSDLVRFTPPHSDLPGECSGPGLVDCEFAHGLFAGEDTGDASTQFTRPWFRGKIRV